MMSSTLRGSAASLASASATTFFSSGCEKNFAPDGKTSSGSFGVCAKADMHDTAIVMSMKREGFGIADLSGCGIQKQHRQSYVQGAKGSSVLVKRAKISPSRKELSPEKGVCYTQL